MLGYGEQMKKIVLWSVIAFSVLLLALSAGVTIKNNTEMQQIMADSIRSQLVSICEAATEIVSEYDITRYNSRQDVENDLSTYTQMRSRILSLAENTGATYIYGFKEIGGKYYFFLDTDQEVDTLFIEYELAEVHANAFKGIAGVKLFEMADEYGSFHSAAMPLYENGALVGVIGADIEDALLQKSIDASRRNIIILIVAQVIVLGLLVYFLFRLLRNIGKMQAQLQHMALYDAVTGLPNRQYLMNYLSDIHARKDIPHYALIFIDLDNFKKVNDTAGHDAGDALLKSVGEFLGSMTPIALAFRPSAGVLNVSARVGGDEFVQVVPGIETAEQAIGFANNMLADFKKLDSCHYVQDFSVGMSIGIALYPYHSDNYHVLIKYADIAMYHAKEMGKNHAVVYSSELAPKNEK